MCIERDHRRLHFVNCGTNGRVACEMTYQTGHSGRYIIIAHQQPSQPPIVRIFISRTRGELVDKDAEALDRREATQTVVQYLAFPDVDCGALRCPAEIGWTS